MLINEKDNGNYSYWKNSTKSRTQTHTITKANVIKTIQEFWNNHPDNKYLLQNEDGSSMNESQVETRYAYIA